MACYNSTHTIQRACPFISSNFSEYKLIFKPSDITSKALTAACDVLCCKSSAERFLHSAIFCQTGKSFSHYFKHSHKERGRESEKEREQERKRSLTRIINSNKQYL